MAGRIGDRSRTSWHRSSSDWDAADGGISSRLRRHSKELRTESREAEAWVNSSKKPQTPQTEASTPDQVGTIPPLYQETISSAFGSKADLYKLLKVNRHASDRDIRIAYFRRGRQVLTDTQRQHSRSAAVTIGGVSEQSKLRFQAVSMAYEILSTPAWRAAYDRTGLMGKDDLHVDYYDSRSIPNSPVSTSSQNRRAGVRWNEEVEELVFDQDPSEFSVQDDSEQGVCGDESRPAKDSRKKKRKKKRVVVEDSDNLLEDHLARLDEVAERDVFNDFLDDLEASIDGLLSFGSTSRGSYEKKERKMRSPPPDVLRPSSSFEPHVVMPTSERRPVTPSFEPQTEMSTSAQPPVTPPFTDFGFPDMAGMSFSEEAPSPIAMTEESNASTPSHSTPTPAHSNVTRTPDRTRKERNIPGQRHHPKELELPDITREKQQKSSSKKKSQIQPPTDIVINPDNLEVQPPSDIVIKPRETSDAPDFSCTPAMFDDMDDTISTISANTSGKKRFTPVDSLLVEPPKIVKSPDTVFADVNKTTHDDVEDHPMDENPNNAIDAISKKSDTSTVATPDIVFCRLEWCSNVSQSTPVSQSTQVRGNHVADNSIAGTPHRRSMADSSRRSMADSSRRSMADSSSYSPVRRREKDSSDLASNFMYHFMAYVKAITNEVTKIGSAVAENSSSLLDGVVLDDDDLESFFGILDTELDRTPQDLS